jgi:hypothetical protein
MLEPVQIGSVVRLLGFDRAVRRIPPDRQAWSLGEGVFAVVVFALPVGVLASGFDDQIAKRREMRRTAEEGGGYDSREVTVEVEDVVMGDPSTCRGRVYDFLHRHSSPSTKLFVVFTAELNGWRLSSSP